MRNHVILTVEVPFTQGETISELLENGRAYFDKMSHAGNPAKGRLSLFLNGERVDIEDLSQPRGRGRPAEYASVLTPTTKTRRLTGSSFYARHPVTEEAREQGLDTLGPKIESMIEDRAHPDWGGIAKALNAEGVKSYTGNSFRALSVFAIYRAYKEREDSRNATANNDSPRRVPERTSETRTNA